MPSSAPPANADHQRAHLISLLWSLKRAVDEAPQGTVPGVGYVHFNALRNDETYRADLLEKAAAAADEQIRSIAEEIRALQRPATDAAEAAAVGQPGVPGGWDRPGAAPYPGAYPNGQAGGRPGAYGGLPSGAYPGQHPGHQAGGYGGPGGGVGGQSARGLGGATTLGFVLAAAALAGGGYLAKEAGLLDRMAQMEIQGSLTQDTLWQSGSTYRLNGLVFVEGRAILTIEPGVRILGTPGSALIVTRDARLLARGSQEAPIVFTSAKPVGERARGDWGGVVLLGNAPVNTKTGHIEGVDKSDSRGAFGGNDEEDSCGVLQYVRVEFAGNEISKDNELNGITLGGCGSGTILRFVQVHMGLDDGVEFFGGSANMSHVVISRSGDDGLDWDRGWTGNGQFIVIQQDGQDGDSGIEADNYKKDPDAEPRSAPTLSNVTIVSGGNPGLGQRGMVLRLGTAGDLRNMLFAGFTLEAIDVRDAATVAQAEAGKLRAGALVFTDVVSGQVFEKETGADDDDGGFDEQAFFLGQGTGSAVIEDAILTRAVYSLTEPEFTPVYNETLMRLGAPVPQGELWDEAANFVGAIRPGSRSDWLEGWAAFPPN